MATVLLVTIILLAFWYMTRGVIRLETAMPLVALCGVVLAGAEEGSNAIREGFAEFSRIAVLFTAVAIPAHLLQRARAFDWTAMLLGEWIGAAISRLRISPAVLIPVVCIEATYFSAALFHNTTAILISAPLITTICMSYELRALPVLCGALVASNLGGFSTRWGDTPNITEATIWGLNHMHFFTEIVPVNLGLMLILLAVVCVWFRLAMADQERRVLFNTVEASIRFRTARRDIVVDKRLLSIGIAGLLMAVLGPIVMQSSEIQFSALSIVFCSLADRAQNRKETLLALSFETYVTLCSIFVLARILTSSHIGVGEEVRIWLQNSGMSTWAIICISYVGTLLTEAASWASAAAPIVYASAPTNAAAWALGAGICAGSSSLVTAASAGVLLINQTRDNDVRDQVTFGSYLIFGIGFSLIMLVYFILVLSMIW